MRRSTPPGRWANLVERLSGSGSRVTLAIYGVMGLLVAGMCIFGTLSVKVLSERFGPDGTSQVTIDTGQIVSATLTALSKPLGDQVPTPTLPPNFPTLPPEVTTYPTTEFKPSNVDVNALLAQMSIEEKVGQMLLSGLSGSTAGDQARVLVNQYYLGGIVYFGDNTRSPRQVLDFSQALQRLAQANPHAVPLLISIDHEGGRIFRFQNGMTHFPSAMTLGAANFPELTYNIAAANALELRSVGINTILGPVLDINDDPANPVIGLRAFGGRADLVARMGERYIAGLQHNGLIATAKHFPGHGSTNIDSHSTLPVVNKTLDELRANELAPFALAVQEGVSVVMVGHIANLIVDPSGLPASLSPVFVQQILREEMGFKGVVMTDALTMGAVTEQYDIPSAAVQAVKAGVDIVAVTGPDFAGGAHAAILQAVRSGAIPGNRIDDAVRRILLLKAQYGLFEAFVPAGGDIEYDRDLAWARQAAQSGVVLSGGSLPGLAPGAGLLVISPGLLPTGANPSDSLSLLGELLAGAGFRVDEWSYPVDNPYQIAAVQQQALQVLPSYSVVILVTYDARLRLVNQGDGAQRDLVNALVGGGIPLVVVVASSPYDLELLPAGQPALATFGILDIQMDALANILLGRAAAVGILPVEIKK